MRNLHHLMCSVFFLGEGEDSTGAQVDPYELLDPVEILSKLPKDFYEKIVSFRSPVARWLILYVACRCLCVNCLRFSAGRQKVANEERSP